MQPKHDTQTQVETTTDNQVQITACDNELLLIAYQWTESFVVAHIKSGNNNKVDVTVNIEQGTHTVPTVLDGVDAPLDTTQTTRLPAGDYTLVAVALNWGGPSAFQYTFKGKTVKGAPEHGEVTAPQTFTV